MTNHTSNVMAYYINVFVDRKGELTQSECGVMDSEAKAQNEAIDYVLNHGWKYVDTLSNAPRFVDFTKAILDAEFQRNFPDSEFNREECEIMWKYNLAKMTNTDQEKHLAILQSTFRPQPTRGSAAQNPATHLMNGEIL